MIEPGETARLLVSKHLSRRDDSTDWTIFAKPGTLVRVFRVRSDTGQVYVETLDMVWEGLLFEVIIERLHPLEQLALEAP